MLRFPPQRVRENPALCPEQNEISLIHDPVVRGGQFAFRRPLQTFAATAFAMIPAARGQTAAAYRKVAPDGDHRVEILVQLLSKSSGTSTMTGSAAAFCRNSASRLFSHG